MDNNLNNIVEKMKVVENSLNEGMIPLLKDSISDYRKIVTKMIIVIIIMIIVMSCVFAYALFIVQRQNNRFQEFLTQFEFDSEIYQDTDDSSTINSDINVTKNK